MVTQLTIPYTTALLTGVLSGISYCTAGCSPFLSTYIMGTTEGILNGVKSFLAFTVGRIFMYAALGFAWGYIGIELVDRETPGFQYVSLVYSIVLILIGLLIFIRSVSGNCMKSNEKTGECRFIPRHIITNPTIHLFVVGMTFALIPCPPMLGIFVYSLQMPSVISSSIIMTLFGIGTAVSPLVIISAVSGLLSKKIKAEAPQYKMLFQGLSGVILILLGVFSAMPAITE
jgi:cytochrome c-type biogenesis protein